MREEKRGSQPRGAKYQERKNTPSPPQT